MKSYFKSTDKVTVDGYPYGRLRATAFFSLEFKKGEGFRSVFQTINPKNNRLNAPKYSTYCPIMAMYRNEANGHVEYDWIRMHGDEDINKAAAFMSEHFDLYTPEMIKGICVEMALYAKASAKATVIYGGAKWEDIKGYYDNAVNALIEGAKTGANVFPAVVIDAVAVDAAKPENFNPFSHKVAAL
jgi:hypothetical protein